MTDTALDVLLRGRADFFRRYQNQHNVERFLSNENRLISLVTSQQTARLLQNVSISLLPANGFFEPVTVAPTPEQIEAAFVTPTVRPEGTCPICQDNYGPTEPIVRLRHCNHCFHRECARTWYRVSVHCPMCRHDIRSAS